MAKYTNRLEQNNNTAYQGRARNERNFYPLGTALVISAFWLALGTLALYGADKITAALAAIGG